MSYCGHCGSKMKPLLTGEFCPNDCDRQPSPDPFDLPKIELVPDAEFLDGWAKALDEWYGDDNDKTPLLSDGDDPGDQQATD